VVVLLTASNGLSPEDIYHLLPILIRASPAIQVHHILFQSSLCGSAFVGSLRAGKCKLYKAFILLLHFVTFLIMRSLIRLRVVSLMMVC
jgi:hypothetical protein